MKKSITAISMQILLYLIFILIWVFTAFIAFMAFNYACFTCFEDLYGQWSLWLGVIIAVLAFLSPLYMRVFVKKKVLIMLLSIAISIAFVAVAFGSYAFTKSQFKEFTQSKWTQYPRQRSVMLDNLKVKHEVIGMSEDEVISILGKPDEVKKGDSIKYYYEYGYIEFVFINGVVSSIDDVDYF